MDKVFTIGAKPVDADGLELATVYDGIDVDKPIITVSMGGRVNSLPCWQSSTYSGKRLL